MVQACVPAITQETLHFVWLTYGEWDRGEMVHHHAVYFNVRIREFVYLDQPLELADVRWWTDGEWSSGSDRKMYYDMKECKYKYTDGSYTSVTLPPTTGIEYTCSPGRIRDVLQKVSLLQFQEEEEGDDVPQASQVAPDT